MDLLVLFYLLISAGGFMVLADYLRRDLRLDLSDGRILFFCLSLNFSLYVLAVGPSWANFIANFGALPWFTFALLQRSFRLGLALVVIFTLHEIFGGQPEPTISTFLVFSLFAIGLALAMKTMRPFVVWFGGSAIGFLLASPLLWNLLDGFNHSPRAGGVSLYDMNRYNVDITLFPLSYFGGAWIPLLSFKYPPNGFAGLLACAAAFYLLPVLFSRDRWTSLQLFCVGFLVLLAVLIHRPAWISQAMLHLPLLRSMRWPFREIMQGLFFLHLLFLLRRPGGTLAFQRGCLAVGAISFVLPFFFTPAPTINPLTQDRQLLFSGRAAAYWDRVRPLFRPGDRYVVIEELNNGYFGKEGLPNVLLGSHNYPMLFQLPSDSGYSFTAPVDRIPLKGLRFWYFGALTREQEPDARRLVPQIRFITLETVHPLKITLSSPDGSKIDLTPFIPPP
jgi:hypothetical protein